MKSLTTAALAVLTVLSAACGESTPASIEEFDMTDNDLSTAEAEAYEEAATGDDVAAWVASLGMEVPADLTEVEEGVAVSDTDQTVFALDCARAEALTREGGAYGPRWEGETAVVGYTPICRA